MNERLQDIDLIERYFDNALSAEETEALRVRVKNDREFQKLFDRETLLVKAIKYEGAARDLAFLKGVEQSIGGKETTVKKNTWYYYAAAASVAILALAVLIPSGKVTPETLYAEYFQPHPNNFDVTLRGESENDLRNRAFQAYEQGNYQAAASLFTELLKTDQDAGALMLLGNSHLMLGKTELAKQNFSDIINNFDDLDTAGKWYLSLSHLRDGEIDEARTLLKEVGSARSPYADRARELLTELE
jgi:TolA-binding protein